MRRMIRSLIAMRPAGQPDDPLASSIAAFTAMENGSPPED